MKREYDFQFSAENITDILLSSFYFIDVKYL